MAKRTFTAPVTRDQLTIPAGAGSAPVRFAGQGSVGEFDGPPGDLIVEIVFDGRPRSHLAHRFVKVAKFVLIVIALVCTGLIVGGVVVSAFT